MPNDYRKTNVKTWGFKGGKMYWFIMTLPLSLLCLVCYMGGRCHGFKQARDTFKPLLDDVMKQNGEMFEFICDINNAVIPKK